MPLTLEQFGLDRLTFDERRELIGLIEASLVAEPPAAWETPEFLAELERRLADARANPGQGAPFEEVYRRAMARCQAKREQ